MAEQDNTKLWRIWNWYEIDWSSVCTQIHVAICLRAICRIPDSCNGASWCNASTKRTRRPGVESPVCHDWFEIPRYRQQVRRVKKQNHGQHPHRRHHPRSIVLSHCLNPYYSFLMFLIVTSHSGQICMIMGTFIMRDIMTKIWNPSVKDIKSLSVQQCICSPHSPGTQERPTFRDEANEADPMLLRAEKYMQHQIIAEVGSFPWISMNDMHLPKRFST